YGAGEGSLPLADRRLGVAAYAAILQLAREQTRHRHMHRLGGGGAGAHHRWARTGAPVHGTLMIRMINRVTAIPARVAVQPNDERCVRRVAGPRPVDVGHG